jgi:ATP-binding cassette, subfamily B, bacterial PglK
MQQLSAIQSQLHLLSTSPRHVLEAMGFVLLAATAVILARTESNSVAAMSVLSVFGFAAFRLLPSVQNVYQNWAALRFGTRALCGLERDLSSARQALFDPDLVQPLALQRSIELRDIRFQYPGAATTALQVMKLSIQAGETVALVGASGAGKSTLADLIMALQVPNSGALLVDDMTIEGDRLARWQRSIGYVPQHIFLLDASIADNVAFGVPSAQQDQAAIWQALKAAALDEFVRHDLPQSLDTMIGERGARLSGGQRQRLGIARALYRQPSVLVLDEATSALDQATEESVMQAMDGLRGAKTIIVIAHRLSTVQRCDRVLFLARGELIASGTYQSLLAECEAFRIMANSGDFEQASTEVDLASRESS